MGMLAEINEAVSTLRQNGGQKELILLKCTSAYPAPAEEANLRTIPHLAQAFNCPTGLSDHTMGSSCAVVAVALGAKVIEKHFPSHEQMAVLTGLSVWNLPNLSRWYRTYVP